MADDFSTLMMSRKPTAERPLLGLTVLVVEDSRFACEAMRLLCLRSGARIRRADCLASARRHLSVYRPTALVVDLGLPDGSGVDLIREVANSDQDAPVILGTSGEDLEADALQAGADGFILKPIDRLAVFQQAILAHLPAGDAPFGLRALTADQVSPDLVALRDDLSHVATLLASPLNDGVLDYVYQFLSSLAQSVRDRNLEHVAGTVADVRNGSMDASKAIGEVDSIMRKIGPRAGPI